MPHDEEVPLCCGMRMKRLVGFAEAYICGNCQKVVVQNERDKKRYRQLFGDA